jgi:hypothetical protein
MDIGKDDEVQTHEAPPKRIVAPVIVPVPQREVEREKVLVPLGPRRAHEVAQRWLGIIESWDIRR